MALHLAERGVDIIFTYRRAASDASEVRERIRAVAAARCEAPEAR
jgi:hypothetical protein